MADESEASKHRRSIPLRSAGLAVAALVLVALVVWGTPIIFNRFPQLSKWEVPLGIAFATVFALAILWKVPQWQVGRVTGLEPKERFDRINEARKTLAQIIGGLAVLAGFYSTVENIKVAQESFALSQQGQITDRLTKAFEQLGALKTTDKKKLEVRLGGIYSLERIANESETDHWPIMEVLTAYVRENAPVRKVRTAKTASLVSPTVKSEADIQAVKPEADIQAILDVIGRRNVEYDRSSILKLNATNLKGAELFVAQLNGAFLQDADLSRAHLNGAYLEGAYLSGAFLYGAHLGEAHLKKAHLVVAHLIGADLTKSDFSEADLGVADLFGANLTGADLTGANLTGANLTGANLTGADLTGADLKGGDLSKADLSRADLTTAKNLEQQQIDSAKGDRNTRLPSNLHMPESWKTP